MATSKPLMDRSYERFRKYQNDVEAHLLKVDEALDEEINNLKRKIKDMKEAVNRSTSQERNHSKLSESAKREAENHSQAIQALLEEQENRERDKIIYQKELQDHERDMKWLENDCDELREQLDQLNYEIKQLEDDLKAKEISGERKSHKNWENKMEESLEKLHQKKAVQDAATRRLRRDARFVEEALERVDNRMLDELRKHQSQSGSLERRTGIFANERINAVDEFQGVLKYFTNDENGDVKEDRKLQAVNHNNSLLLGLLKTDCDRMSAETRNQRRETQKLEKSNSKLKKKFEDLLEQYEELKAQKADGIYRDFSLEGLVFQDQKKKLKEKFARREKETDDLLGIYNRSKFKFKRNRMDRHDSRRDDGKLAELKKELVNATRRETALRAKLERLGEKNSEMEEEIAKQRRILEEMGEEVRKIDEDLPAKDEIVVDSVTVTTDEDRIKTQLEKKEAELEEILERLELSNEQEQKKLQDLKDSLFTLNSKYQALSSKRDALPDSEATDLKREIKHLKQEESALNKTIAQLQREMQLSLIRREAAVGKAQSVVPLTTNIRGERKEELESLRRRVEEKRKELEKILVE